LNALISFERRLKKFRNKQMNFYDIPWVKTASILNIDRRFLLWNTFKAVKAIRMKWYQPRQKFFIKFIGENGIDAGGLKNDWMTNILHSVFLSNPLAVESNVLQPIFIKVDDETGLYAPNPIHKPEIFKLAGSIIGLSLAMNIPIKQKFIPAIYCALMHEEIDLVTDLMEQSPTIFKSMQYLNDPSVKISEMQLNLLSKPSIYVNRRLVPKYIKEYSKDVLIGRYEREIEALVDGFESVLPISIQDYFTLSEFKKILTGKPADYSPDEFINALVCKDLAIKNALRRFIAEITSIQRGLLLKFITGLNALPADGFERLERKISVVIDRSLIGKLPTSFTCTFTLKLPPYLDYETFLSALMRAIEWTSATDNQVGLSNEDEGIELGFDSDSEIEDDITTGTMLQESESDISDFYESDYDSSVSEVEYFTTLDIESDFLPDAYTWLNNNNPHSARNQNRLPRSRIIHASNGTF
jgi:E3 ubiquitin-protein ligase HECTD2